MARKYVPRSKQPQKWTEADMSKAIRLALTGHPVRALGKEYSIPHNTLNRRLHLYKMKKIQLSEDIPARIPTSTFTQQQEEDLIDYSNSVMEKKNGLFIRDFRKVVFEFAEQNGIKNRFNEKLRMAGHDFVQSFLKRHPNFVLKKREGGISKKEHRNGKKCVENYFNSLNKVLIDHAFEPHDIYHCGQLSLNCINVIDNVTSPIEKKDYESDCSISEPKLVTVICCANSVGSVIPPVFSFPKLNMKENLLDHAPFGSIGLATENGSVNAIVVLRFLKHFTKHTRCSGMRRVLLLTSGLESIFLMEPTLAQYSATNGINILSIPPHTVHYLHPLHKSLFKPLKNLYEDTCKVWMRQHPYRNITECEVPHIFRTAYLKVLTLDNVTEGFVSCGVCPFNPNAEIDAYKLELEGDLEEEQTMPSFDIDQPGPSNEVPPSALLFTNSEAQPRINCDLATTIHQSMVQSFQQFHNGAIDFI